MQVHRGSRCTRPVGMRTRRAWLKTAAQTAAAGLVAASPLRAAPRPWRIAHVMSFESPWRWTDGQLAGFQQALAAPDAEYRVFQMDASEFEQGLAAGRLAAAVLRDGQAPAGLPVRATTRGHPALSLARARQLGIAVRSRELLACEVVRRFAWDAA